MKSRTEPTVRWRSNYPRCLRVRQPLDGAGEQNPSTADEHVLDSTGDVGSLTALACLGALLVFQVGSDS